MLLAVHMEINCSRASRASTQTSILVIAHIQEEYPLARKTIGPGPLHLLRYPQRETEPVSLTRKPEEEATETGMSERTALAMLEASCKEVNVP
jgi:hypothetical protein